MLREFVLIPNVGVVSSVEQSIPSHTRHTLSASLVGTTFSAVSVVGPYIALIMYLPTHEDTMNALCSPYLPVAALRGASCAI